MEKISKPPIIGSEVDIGSCKVCRSFRFNIKGEGLDIAPSLNDSSLHAREESIQQRWRELAFTKGDADATLCTDGLLFRGAIYYKDGCWHRQRGDEEIQWCSSPRRLLILTKDPNDLEGCDIRQETGRYNEVAFSYERSVAFIKNLRMWSYLLLNGTSGNMPSFKNARNMNLSGPFYESAPIARVNCKKQVGWGSLADTTLKGYLEDYAELLTEQIALYDANIILCCGYSSDKNIILDFVRSQYLTDLRLLPDTGDWMYYSPSTGKIAVNSYHPSARVGYEDTFYNLSDAYEVALNLIRKNYNREF